MKGTRSHPPGAGANRRVESIHPNGFYQNAAAPAATQFEKIDALSDALAQAGQPVDHIEVDGEIHRYHPHGKHKGDMPCWYSAHWLNNGQLVAHFGDHRIDPAGKGTEWRSWEHLKGEPVDREAIAREQAERKRQSEKEAATRQTQAAKKARELWDTLSDTGESTYLEQKQVPAPGVRYGQDKQGSFIAVSMQGPGGELRGLQRIYDNGTKRFSKSVAKKGAYHLIGTVKPEMPLYVAEGYATAASVFLATDCPVAICFDAGNIGPVLENLRKLYPEQCIGIAADNDQWKPDKGNPGKDKATEAARRYGAFAAWPNFHMLDTSERPTDFNDLHRLAGLERVKQDLEQGELGWFQREDSRRKAENPPVNPEADIPLRKRFRVDEKGV